nr:EOG090X06VP [Triops cancriformis]
MKFDQEKSHTPSFLVARLSIFFFKKNSRCNLYSVLVVKWHLRRLIMKGKVVDLMLVVEDAEAFHRDNLKRNGCHYPLPLRFLGPKAVARVQTRWGAQVYFNTLIPVDNGLIKYGVITRSALVADLLDWDWLYTSGRLHKPVQVLQSPWTSDLRTALKKNLQSALHAALLLLPDAFSEEKLYKTLTGLSYGGDFRMVFGEDKNKVDKIVGPHLQRFNQLYSPYFPALADRLLYHPTQACLEQDTSPAARLFHLNLLPKTVQQELVNEWNKDGKYHDVEDVLRAAAHDTDCPELVQKALQRIVWRSSWSQSLKGIITAGPIKALRYSARKVRKMVESLNEKEKPKMIGG